MSTSDPSDATTALASLAVWLERSGYVLRRVHAGQFVFRHPQRRVFACVPADPAPALVALIVAAVEAAAEAAAHVEAFPTTASTRDVSSTAELSESELLAHARAVAAAYEPQVTAGEGGGFVGSLPALGGIFGQGATVEDAYRSALDALTAAIAVLLEDGEGVPAPTAAATAGAAPDIA